VFGTFATGGCDGYVNIWDGAAKKRLFVLPKFPSSVAALSFNHDGSLLVRAARCCSVGCTAADMKHR
jgi:cell cycle arrest protein BUB3